MVRKLQKLLWPCLITSMICVAVLVQPVTIGWTQTLPGTDFPVPSEPHQIFFLQRSMNSNTIVYAARLGSDKKLDRRDPIEIFWRRFSHNGENLPITYTERILAFGVRIKPLRNATDAYLVTLVAYPGRSAVLRIADGRPQLEGKVAGQDARLISAFLYLDESGRIPRVIKVDLRGEALASKQPLFESFIP